MKVIVRAFGRDSPDVAWPDLFQGRGPVGGGSEKDAENSIVWLHSWVRLVLAGISRAQRVGVPDPS
ncbi:hypothetical protein H633G_11535 [Metarhizium anisopliae BRIP 53284]|nr:hypothetical protein H633G_11535 [Metarhizium anisopliae BRIP 53284]